MTPAAAVDDADRLVQEVMRQRGYPVDEFDERLEMVSVDHPELADNYRVAHAIQLRSGRDSVSIDELREAFQRYRALFDDLLADGAGGDQDAGTDEDDRTRTTGTWPRSATCPLSTTCAEEGGRNDHERSRPSRRSAPPD